MTNITEQQYEFARKRVEELLPIADDTIVNNPLTIELSLMSDIVIEYEKEHFPIEKPTAGQLISNALEEHDMTQKELASRLGVSPSRVNDYISGRSEPSLHMAGNICRILNIAPKLMMQL